MYLSILDGCGGQDDAGPETVVRSFILQARKTRLLSLNSALDLFWKFVYTEWTDKFTSCAQFLKKKKKSDISLCKRKTRSCRSRVCKVLNKTETENENRNTLGNSNDFSGGQQTNFVKTNYCHLISNNLFVVWFYWITTFNTLIEFFIHLRFGNFPELRSDIEYWNNVRGKQKGGQWNESIEYW